MALSVYLVFALLLVGFEYISALPKETERLVKILHDVCVKETGVDEQLIVDANYGMFSEDPKLKCYMLCHVTTIPIMNTTTGMLDIDTLIDIIPEKFRHLAEPIFRNCGTVKGVDNCDTAYQTNKCWQQSSPGYYHLP